ncbi:MAG: YjbH domain-containing protein [Bacteroidales bacterium]|nr:YjbH domain-containing protein [Bacteroidales bacterium]
MKKILVSLLLLMLAAGIARAQFLDSSSGLLQMPTAEMQDDGSFMITNNYVNKNALSSRAWGYDTFQYGFAFTFWSRLEVGYVCTIFDGKRRPNPSERDLIMFNQDRHFTGRFQLLKEGEFGLKWMPSLVVGISDPATGGRHGNYLATDVSSGGNAFFNRNFIVLSKSIPTAWGVVGVHAGYQFNWRRDYAINAPCVGVNWRPVWLNDRWILDNLSLIAEYDSRTPNVGFIASVWDNRFEAMFEWQNFRWINFGLRYKLRLRK